MLAAGRADGADMATDAIEGLTEDHFTATPHKVALRSYKRLNESGSKIDLLTLTSDLEQLGVLESAGGFAYLAECSKTLRLSQTLQPTAKSFVKCTLVAV
ncbi:replicative DNA helicase [Klebsiella pneumoniae subsp. ozaenae]|uniref:Replicative DNA helicase n=1 Tax=Klebsiella pneumoniae subsp. ozaenae TaxID=574 RepID=A0A378ACZ0_KLEPO|nr:replicative DNA helicase [Klebsiella pneumoniae subsp. ozaenae]